MKVTSSTAIRPAHTSVSNPNSVYKEPLSYVKGRKLYHGYYKSSIYDDEFKALIKDAYTKRWGHDDFPWDSNVEQNIKSVVDSLSPSELLRVAKMCLPLVKNYPKEKIERLHKDSLPTLPEELSELKEAIVKRQFRGLQDIANHALTAEQAAVAPLSTGIIAYRRYPQVQEAITLFVNDEARHSSVFERYLTNKLGGEKHIYTDTVQQFDLFRYVAKVLPGATVFLALAVETVGGAFFEFFADRSPEPLFKEICAKIARLDEKRHMVICRTLYNLVHHSKKQSKLEKTWEDFRNKLGMKFIAKELYAQQADPNHYLMQALTALGIEPKELINYISKRVQEEFAQIGFNLTTFA